jgi:hypothetical protein
MHRHVTRVLHGALEARERLRNDANPDDAERRLGQLIGVPDTDDVGARLLNVYRVEQHAEPDARS